MEQPKRKPKAAPKRKSDYSGKKKRHTLKQIVISTPSGIIVDQSPSIGGRAHDFKVFKDDRAARSLCEEFKDYRVTIYGDSGFAGMKDVGLPATVSLNEKARCNHPLTRDQKKLNRLRSSTRISVEHTFSRRKKYRIVADIYRNRDEDIRPRDERRRELSRPESLRPNLSKKQDCNCNASELSGSFVFHSPETILSP